MNSSRETAAKIIPFAYVASPSAKDPLWEKKYPGKSTLIILTAARYEWFEEWKEERVSKRGEEYDDLKNSFVEALMETVFGIYPQVKDKIEHVSAGTPLSNQHYIAAPRQDVLVGGLMGAMHSALLCASAVLDRNVYIDLVQLRRKIKANNFKKEN
ncbi:UNVERIFIED_CONTAM: hypothetical protein K2H54_026212 [Gekko kuhli]